jgi:hypothetical protein
MRDSARRVMLYSSVFFLCVALLTEHANAAQCSDIYPGAEIGPPPEWTFWGDGSACYVRWTPETSQHEDKLLEQCRNTSGARFVHFERDKGAGHSICLFKILGLTAPSKEPNPLPSTSQGLTPVASPQEEDPLQDQKNKSEDSLGALMQLVHTTHEDCPRKERAKETTSAAACWQDAVKALEALAPKLDVVARQRLKGKLDQLRSTWIKQAEQLNERVSNSSQEMAAIETVSTPADAPDPQRITATAACSSTKLGDYRHCVGPAISKEQNQFTFVLKPDCDNGAVAAISTTDEKGRCLRKVISLSPDARTIEVESHGEPAVIDAIAFREGIYECYARRHEKISCDGKVDFDNLHRSTEHVVPKRRPQLTTARKKSPPKKQVIKEQQPQVQARPKRKLAKKEAALQHHEKETSPSSGTTKSVKCSVLPNSC